MYYTIQSILINSLASLFCYVYIWCHGNQSQRQNVYSKYITNSISIQNRICRQMAVT